MEGIKSFWKMLRPAVSVTVLLMLICGLAYPLFMTGISALIFPGRAQGSLCYIDGRAAGSEYVGQEFTKPWFMKGRPSAVHYNTYISDEDGREVYNDGTPFQGIASGSYNYGPSNEALYERVEGDIEKFLEENPGVSREDIPTDLMTASGSGLDPHISPASAEIQLPGISRASGLPMDTLRKIVADNTEAALFGIFGEAAVNVLKVNMEIAKAMGLI